LLFYPTDIADGDGDGDGVLWYFKDGGSVRGSISSRDFSRLRKSICSQDTDTMSNIDALIDVMQAFTLGTVRETLYLEQDAESMILEPE
jgi:hypothetical protein